MAKAEDEVFIELARLCASPGYVHALALLVFSNNVIPLKDELTSEHILRQYSQSRLLRAELSTVIGLWLKNQTDFGPINVSIVQNYIEQTEMLLHQLHEALTSAVMASLSREHLDGNANPFSDAMALREPIFYGGESAYDFQYREFAALKYMRDSEWLTKHKGYDVALSPQILRSIKYIQSTHMINEIRKLHGVPKDQWSLLSCFTFSADEVAAHSSLQLADVETFLEAFCFDRGCRNEQFNSLTDFNAALAFPLVRTEPDRYLLFQQYTLAEASYDTPFYWMMKDGIYKTTAEKNRGKFTEEFAYHRLKSVFGKHVYPNVRILKTKGEEIGEIDAMVIYGRRVLIIQAKSKKLTLESRKGNDRQIRGDFKKAVQDAYDQALKCAQALRQPNVMLVDSAGKRIEAPSVETCIIYPMCIVSDHYPALAFQAYQFLSYERSEDLAAPMVTDIFALDALCEMLESPLRLLSYFVLRAKFSERLFFTHEFAALSYHLHNNLWLESDNAMVHLTEDITAHLDAAMMVRRDGVAGSRTPAGILTRLTDTSIGKLISEIEGQTDVNAVELGMLLVQLSEPSLLELGKNIDEVAIRCLSDGRMHDVTVGLDEAHSGITIHCYAKPPFDRRHLQNHCLTRKHMHKAEAWFGAMMRAQDKRIYVGVNINFPWHENEIMDAKVAEIEARKPLARPAPGSKQS